MTAPSSEAHVSPLQHASAPAIGINYDSSSFGSIIYYLLFIFIYLLIWGMIVIDSPHLSICLLDGIL